MATQRELALQMIAQLRVLDPSVSAEIGTPERKIIDTVAQALAESQIDLNLLNGALDLSAKFGADLDRFLGIFGFGRQKATRAQGFVTFSRTTASSFDITIPRGTQVSAPSVEFDGTIATNLLFRTTDEVRLVSPATSVVAPVECVVTGTIGNIAANIITDFGGQTILGITAVVNQAPTAGGLNAESDEEFKIRFKNTVFRNLSGTQDQYLALAVSTAFTTKANVVGPISRYREYIQVPDVDDATADPDSGLAGAGSASEWTSALSTIPYSKHVYDTIPYFVSSGLDETAFFYRQDTDYYLNVTDSTRTRGDAYRNTSIGVDPVAYPYAPNLTFLNVYSGTDDTVQALRPKDVVLFEHSYMSTASRNDWSRNLMNCVDVYINGSNEITANAIIPRPAPGTNLFTGNSNDRYYFDNFRRVGEPNHRPILANLFTALFWQPMTDLPDQIVVGDVTYTKGIHYWAVEDVSDLRGTLRSRNGIEWSIGVNGQASGDPDDGPYTGAKISANAVATIEIENYFYDKNIIDLQAALEGSKQVTTDVLAHRATDRYFKLDLTVMYSPGSSTSEVNTNISEAVTEFFESQYFGTTIQLSDILQTVHNASGVDNVRFSKEILTAQGLTTDTRGNARQRVVECDRLGNPLLGSVIERKVAGDGSTTEVWQMYLTGAPTGGTYTITYNGTTTAALAYNATGSEIISALSTALLPITVSSGAGTALDPHILTFDSSGARSSITMDMSRLTGGASTFDTDFYLKDDELPALPLTALSTDILPGLILRPRAQNTWNQL